MRRRSVAIASAAAAVALGGGLLLAPTAQAEPAICVNLDLQVQDQELVQDICLPPEGGEAPGVPGLPELPGGELPSIPGLPG